jgi:hypothetical protein
MIKNQKVTISYFKLITNMNSQNIFFSEVLEVSFRGRPLNGIKFNFPKETTGVVLNQIKSTDDQSQKEQIFKVTNKFDHLHSWNLDEPNLNSKNDQFTSSMNDWFSISKIVS